MTTKKTNLLQTCLMALALLALPAVVQAQFNFTTNNGTITITGYTGTNTVITIPDTINGLPVTSIGDNAFAGSLVTTVTIPDGVTNIGDFAFDGCSSLTSVTIPDSVTRIGLDAFTCWSLTNFTVSSLNLSYSSLDGVLFDKSQVTLIAWPKAKAGNCTIPGSVTSIAYDAFYSCPNMTGVYFKGNPPYFGQDPVFADNNVVIYYLPGTTGWSFFYGGRPTALWLPQVQTVDASFGVRTNQFGFNINWASGQTVVVEACANLANPLWLPVVTNTLTSDSAYFSDPQWTNYPARFYRLRSQ